MIQKAHAKTAQLVSYVKKSYDKTLVGRTVWKQKMMTALMYGKQVITLPKKTIKKLRSIENRVFRYLIGVAGYVAVVAIRGEVGASRVENQSNGNNTDVCKRHTDRKL